MLFLNVTSSADTALPTRAQVSDSVHWNLWRVRQSPYKDLVDGIEVVLVASWPGGGRLTWLVRVTNLVATTYSSKADAVRQIARALGLHAADVRRDDYTVQGPDTGVLLAWRPRPVRRLDLPRPLGMRFRPNGWLRVDDPATLERWRLHDQRSAADRPTPHISGGQGRLEVAERLAVEQHAMGLAAEWCRRGGWPIVDDVSGRKSWDLEARKTRNGRPLFVEVKGTTDRKVDVELTESEVRHAQANAQATALVVVTDITLQRGELPTASGGKVNPFHPWSPTDSELTPTRYRWRASGTSKRL